MSRQSIMDHLRWHLPKGAMKCEPQVTATCECCYELFDVEVLDSHMKKAHKTGGWDCHECDETFLYFERLRM